MPNSPNPSSLLNPELVNRFLNKIIMTSFGYAALAKIGNSAGAVTADSGNMIYAIKADGAAPVIITAATWIDGTTTYANAANLTILAGDVLYLPCTTFTLQSGKYIAYQMPLSEQA